MNLEDTTAKHLTSRIVRERKNDEKNPFRKNRFNFVVHNDSSCGLIMDADYNQFYP